MRRAWHSRHSQSWIRLLAALVVALSSTALCAQEADEALQPLPAPSRSLYASLGIGFINIDQRGPGVRAPLGFVAAFNRQRLIARATLLDLSFLEGDNRDARYARSFSAYAPSNCHDTQTNYYVSNYRCSGGTDLLGSASAELNYVVLRDVWLSEHQGQVFAGAGWRWKSPRSAYGSIGFFFERPRQSSGGVQLLIGRGFVGFGLLWGYDLRRLF